MRSITVIDEGWPQSFVFGEVCTSGSMSFVPFPGSLSMLRLLWNLILTLQYYCCLSYQDENTVPSFGKNFTRESKTIQGFPQSYTRGANL